MHRKHVHISYFCREEPAVGALCHLPGIRPRASLQHIHVDRTPLLLPGQHISCVGLAILYWATPGGELANLLLLKYICPLLHHPLPSMGPWAGFRLSSDLGISCDLNPCRAPWHTESNITGMPSFIKTVQILFSGLVFWAGCSLCPTQYHTVLNAPAKPQRDVLYLLLLLMLLL